jgi:hypothetical protein
VKINGGGKITMKDETKEVTYTEEEEKLSVELCSAINADKELAMFFKQRLGSILKKFAGEILLAFKVNDREKAKQVTMDTGEQVKALTMHMYVKVKVKKKVK